jgi:pimeloyl-ACP methyl ester carboxylesterase
MKMGRCIVLLLLASACSNPTQVQSADTPIVADLPLQDDEASPEPVMDVAEPRSDLGEEVSDAAPDPAFETMDDVPSDVPWTLTVDWSPCTEYKTPTECAAVEVPLDWDDPAGPRIQVYVRRLVGTRPGQLWLLQGGPGLDSHFMASAYGPRFRDGSEMDVYVIDHRGTGKSTALACPGITDSMGCVEKADAPAWQECAATLSQAWGEGLRHFSISQAAQDVIAIAAHERIDTEPVALAGFSFGTRWALRIVALAPELVSAVVLDSISPLDWSWVAHKVDANAVGQRNLDSCASDPICLEKMGPDPAQQLTELGDKIRQGHCPTSRGLTPRQYRRFLWYAASDDWMFAPLVYRLNRCAPADEAAILFYLDKTAPFQEAYSNATAMSGGLYANVALNEAVFPDDPPVAEIEAAEEAAVISEGEASALRYLRDLWPVAPFDAAAHVLPDSAVPMLMLAGGLDQYTQLDQAQHVADKYHGPGQTLVVVPRVGHIINQWTCAAKMIYPFLKDLTAPVDVKTCDSQGQHTYSDWDSQWTDEVFGTGAADLWENL